MRKHTTHFDDCGCKSEIYEAQITQLREQLAAVKRELAVKLAECETGESGGDELKQRGRGGKVRCGTLKCSQALQGFRWG